ncbi:MAG: fibronectin type III domain-containing protein, partial [Deltaproteobacteria bacterium]
MRKHGWLAILILFLLYFLPFFNPAAEGGTGSIRARIVLPGDTGVTIPLSVGIHALSIRPFDGGDGGGGDGGGGGSGGDGGPGDSGYYAYPALAYAQIESVKILEDRILKLENLNAGLKNLIVKYEKDMKDQFGNLIKDQYGNVKKEEFQLALKNIRVVEGQVTDLKDLLMKKGGTITGSITFAGDEYKDCATKNNCPTATVNIVGFAGIDPSALPPWMNNRTITMTDLTGSFTLTNLPEGTYTLAITPGGGAAATHAREIINNVSVISEQTTSATPFGPFELTETIGPLNGTVSLSDKDNGAYEGTIIRATSEDGKYRSYIQATDINGRFDFGKIPEGKYSLYVQHTGYKVTELTGATAVPVTAGATSPFVAIELTAGTKMFCGKISLGEGGYILGDINHDRLITLADVILSLKVLSKLPNTASSTDDVSGDKKIGLSEAIYDLQIISGLRLPSNFVSLSGTLVLVPGTSLMAVTDAEGKFSIAGVPKNNLGLYNYDIFITRDGYKAVKLEKKDAQTTCGVNEVSALLARNETVVKDGKIVSQGSIMGRAWLKKSTDDYRGIDVAIENTGFVAKPNVSGNFIFTDVPPGRYTLNYTNAGYKTVTEAGVLVTPDLTTEARNVVLIPRNGTIKGQIKLEGANDWSNIPIRVEPVEAQIAGYKTDASGYFSIPVSENFNVLTNTKCVLNNTTGNCTGSASYTVVAGGGVWAQSDYQPHTFTNVNVPAGETVDLGTVELKKPPEPPSGVAALQKDGSSVNVSWTASISAASPSTDVTGYNVYYGTRSDAIDQKANTAIITAQTGGKWQFTVIGLEKGILYYFDVQAERNNLTSAKAPGNGSCKLTLIPDGTKITQVTCINCSFESNDSRLTDIALISGGNMGYVANAGSLSVYKVDFAAGVADESNKIVFGLGADLRALAFNPVLVRNP